MAGLLKLLATDTSGQDLGEYGIALTVIAAAIVVAALLIGADVSTLWNTRAGIFAAL